ncbi:MAG: HIT family hydrolase [Candidatus Aminicenantes bacterium RBG_19FT_COMBO_58_17]|nr:MAG: HIT family hydrolase [Candidatus Aminicenantes bacterium RBG_19FT_COMBO_58_17]HCS47922.1 HIT family hydrolase [Candidatus Aminicenantes bacterium]
MEYISAPWRGPYVRQVCRMRGCVLCRALKVRDDRRAYILYRGKYNFVLLNKFPYTPGHLMIAPFRHTASFDRVGREASAEMASLLQLSLKILKKSVRPHGFNAGMNLGQSAGAGVVHHFHLHVIPRWHGDSNFMPLVSQTRVLIEDLDSTYDRLLPFFRKESRRPGRKQ